MNNPKAGKDPTANGITAFEHGKRPYATPLALRCENRKWSEEMIIVKIDIKIL
jgi:hypothetical protein